MSGPNQHHIPRLLQRYFGVRLKGKRTKEIWIHRRDLPPELGKISETASEDYFYSRESADGSPTLDDHIQQQENRIAPLIANIRDGEPGAVVDPMTATTLVLALAPRTSHIRSSLAKGVRDILLTARTVFTDRERTKAMFGLDESQPGEGFRAHFHKIIDGRPEVSAFGLPPTLLERVLFYLARERFEEGIDQQLEFFSTFIGGLAANAGDLVRDAHNRAITSLDTHGERGAELSSFSWTVEAAVTAPAVLPDCVALSYAADGTALPFMYAGIGMQSVVMPLSRNRLLVGRRSGGVLPDLAAFNRHAAACSHQFFLAETDAPNIAALGALIDSRAGDYLGETLGKELAETLPQHVAKPDRLCGPEAVSPKLGDGGVDCRITCIGCATSTAEQIIDAAKTVIGGLSDMLPMARLDGVLFAADYPAALASIDRGDPALPPPQTIDSDQGEGIGQMVVVIREGEVRGLIVLHLSIGKQLAGEAGYPRDWALHLLAYELVLVAMIEWFDGALPGRLLRSVGTLLEGALYAQVDAALNGYVASRLSAGFGDAYAIAAGHREQLATALDRLRGLGLPQRLAYRLHGDMDRLLSVVLPAVAAVLDSAAALIGHAQASELPVLDDEGELRAALDRAGLGWWLADYWEDLERLWRGLGQWSSFDEFLAFNRHVERLMWSVGLFPCEGPGGPRIEIPLITDAAVLEGARP